MKLTIIDFDEFIKKENVKPVTSTRIYSKPDKMDPNGLFSEEVFGHVGSSKRRETFGFVNLRCRVLHPEVYSILLGLNPILSKLILKKIKYIVVDGELIEDDKNGSYGVYYFTQIVDKLNLDKLFKDKPVEGKFVIDNLSKIIIDKYLILPAGIRDISVTRSQRKTQQQFAEISQLYSNLIQSINSLPEDLNALDFDILSAIIDDSIQRILLTINNWIKDRMRGKSGLIRAGLLRKTIDYSGRLVVTTDSTLELGYIGLPWQTVLKLFEPFALNYILYKDKTFISLIEDQLKIEGDLDINYLKRFFGKLNENPDMISEQLKDYFFYVAEEISKDKSVIYKRDPVENRDSYLAAHVRIDKNSFVMKLNPLDLPRTGGDHDGDAYAVFALFTKEAQEEIKEKMHPRYSKSLWTKVTSANECPYSITLDAATMIYRATII